ncbi:hypothetical protein PUN28_013880 [Cardiocondyla obscurior]|uniref:Uncharacterized protein n=1 Tax=Cardiocondyla obscurior TaxID=286306 RepID=A0AAW2F6U0_9HYME
MESGPMPPRMESPGEDHIMLIETVKSIVTHDARNGAEDFFLIPQNQAAQYSETNVDQAASSATVTLDWMHLCRICANACERMIPIFEGDGMEHDLASKILKHLPIHVCESDTLPLQLCENCANILIAWHELSEGCLNAERKLLEMQETRLQSKQQYYSAPLDNLEVTAPILTTADTTITSNITNSLPENQQEENKNEVHKIEKNNKSNRLKNQSVVCDRIIVHNYSRRANKMTGRRNKINPVKTKSSTVIDEDSKNIFTSADNIDNDKLVEDLSPTNTSLKMFSSNKLTSDKRNNIKDKDSSRDNQTRLSCTKDTKVTERVQQESTTEENEIYEHMENNVKQLKKAACTSPTMVCKCCNKKFRSRKSCWAHVRMHSGEKSYTCHVCGKQFVQGGSLYYHLKHVHDGVKNHTCDICGRSFAMKTAMEDHRRIHTGERPYVCHTCGKTFKAKASLYIHSKTHTNEFPHKCTYCTKKFRWKQQLLSHLTVHTGEKNHMCDVCGKGFGVKNNLTRHKRVHSQEKPYTCQQCGSSFGQKRYLKSHERLKLGTCRHSQSSSRIESD